MRGITITSNTSIPLVIGILLLSSLVYPILPILILGGNGALVSLLATEQISSRKIIGLILNASLGIGLLIAFYYAKKEYIQLIIVFIYLFFAIPIFLLLGEVLGWGEIRDTWQDIFGSLIYVLPALPLLAIGLLKDWKNS